LSGGDRRLYLGDAEKAAKKKKRKPMPSFESKTMPAKSGIKA
jgi:hypothetical protein